MMGFSRGRMERGDSGFRDVWGRVYGIDWRRSGGVICVWREAGNEHVRNFWGFCGVSPRTLRTPGPGGWSLTIA